MATRTSLSEEDLRCTLCREVFSTPVVLKCNHNFCKSCLHKRWEMKSSRECPMCRRVSSSARPPINLPLKIAAESFQEQRTRRAEEKLCVQHNKKLNLFCQNDEELICLICQASKEHKIHECSPVNEAAMEKKLEISNKLEALHKQLKELNKTKQKWEETHKYIETQAQTNERIIKEEFESLHAFLWEEEKAKLMKLKQEADIKKQVMSDKLKHIEEVVKNLSSVLSELDISINARDSSFLENYKQIKTRAKYNVQEQACIRDILIDSAKHLEGLKFGIWKKMFKSVKCVPFTLDPNTAQPNLHFSDELTCVRYGRKQELPDNPERCNSRIAVLGSKGFTSGKHCWTVDVGQGRDWYLGVALDSIKRKETIFLNPAEGFWVIGLCNGDTYWAQTSPRTKLTLKHQPHRITVELDYNKGKVSFLNPVDSTLIHMFKDRFTEKLFPYFSPGMLEEGKCASPLKICSLKVSVNIE